MKETIIFAPGCNPSALYRETALCGMPLIGCRVMDSEALASYALARCGKTAPASCSANDETYLLYAVMKDGLEYFRFAVFNDAVILADILRKVRSLIIENEAEVMRTRLSEGEFAEKNEALAAVYARYTAAKQEQGIHDHIDCLRHALREAAPVEDIDFIVLKEFPLSPLETALLKTVAGSWQTRSLQDFLPEKPDKQPVRFIKAYDTSNELENVLNEIFENNLPLDTCTLIAADSRRYAQLLYDASRLYDVPVTYGTGLPVTNANAADLLVRYKDFIDRHHGVEGLKRLLTADSFDLYRLLETMQLDGKQLYSRRDFEGFLDTCGQLRLDGTDDDREKLQNYAALLKKTHAADMEHLAELNETQREALQARMADQDAVMNAMEIFSRELHKGIAFLLRTYTRRRPEHTLEYDLDETGAVQLADLIEEYTANTGGDWQDIFADLLSGNILRQTPRPGCLHLTTIHGALLSLREHNYVLGLSADAFPGTPRENYLFLDDDLERFMPGCPYTSVNTISRKKEELNTVLAMAAHLGQAMTLSYASYNMATIKTANPSSAMFEYYRTLHPEAVLDTFTKDMRETGFFANRLNPVRRIGQALSRAAITWDPPAPDAEAKPILRRTFSPSAIEQYFACGKMFYYRNILGIYEDDEDDPLEIIPANDFGSMAHALFEDLAAQMVSAGEFRKMAEDAFDDYLTKRIPVHPQDAEREKRRFVTMMVNAYADDPKNTVLAAEEELFAKHPSGIIVKGYPDRVEQDANGLDLIADFKTGRKVLHKDNDVASCLQVMLYAFILTDHEIDIRTCVYRYLRLRKRVRIDYTPENIAVMNNMLDELGEALKNNSFSRLENARAEKGPCRFCHFARLCGLGKEDN